MPMKKPTTPVLCSAIGGRDMTPTWILSNIFTMVILGRIIESNNCIKIAYEKKDKRTKFKLYLNSQITNKAFFLIHIYFWLDEKS